MKTWTIEEERLTDGSNVFNVVSYQINSTVSLPCVNWKEAKDLADLLNEMAPTVDIYCRHGE